MNPVQIRAFVQLDERDLEEIRGLAPTFATTRWVRFLRRACRSLLFRNGKFWLLDRAYRRCVYCGRVARRRCLAVNPISLQRGYEALCRRERCFQALRAWEGSANARRRRAQYDWEREHPAEAAGLHVGVIPPQYPSISRATLRAFLDSDAEVATVLNHKPLTATALNGSIRVLGFADQVFAEIRSNQVILRRVPAREGLNQA